MLKESNSGMGRAAAGIGTAAEVDQRQESNSSWFRGQQGSNRGRCQKAAGVKQQQETNPISTTTDLVRLNLHSQPNPCHTASNYQPTDPIRTITDPVQLTLYNQPSYCTDPKYRLTKPIHITTVMFCLQFKSTTRDKKPRAENSIIRKHCGDVGTASAGGSQTAAGVERRAGSN